ERRLHGLREAPGPGLQEGGGGVLQVQDVPEVPQGHPGAHPLARVLQARVRVGHAAEDQAHAALLRLGGLGLPSGARPGELRVRSHTHHARPARHPRQLLPLLRLHGRAALHVLPRPKAYR
ncbi:unnamed protein product, partial [Ectocarpus sp. 12 AP-2014]